MMNIEKTKQMLLYEANIVKAQSLSMQKNLNQVMRRIGHIQTQWPADIASISKLLRNTNRRELKKTNVGNTKQRQRNTRSRTSFNKLQREIFSNNKCTESQSIHFIIFSWSRTNEKNSNFQIQHECSAMK